MHVLGLVDAVACEDTRVGGALLRHLGLAKPLLALHAHNERQASREVLARLGRGERVAYISDAGTPAVSDPGAALVAEASAAGHRCMPLPGASSVLAALCVAGDVESRGVRFIGFADARGASRREAIDTLARAAETQVLFEAPHRIAQLAQELAQRCPDRPVTVARELTKQFESIARLQASALPGWLAADAHRSRGEFVLVLHALPPTPGPPADQDDEALRPWLLALLDELPLRQAAALAATASGRPRKAVYALALRLRDAAASARDEPGDVDSSEEATLAPRVSADADAVPDSSAGDGGRAGG